MRFKLYIILCISMFYGCRSKIEDSGVKTPLIIEGIYDLNGFFSTETYRVAMTDFYDKLKDSKDSIDIKKLKFCYDLYDYKKLNDSLWELMKNAIIAQTKMDQNQQDTILYANFLENYSNTFTKNIINEKSIREPYSKVIDLQKQIVSLRTEIIKGQRGKGHIECREIGVQLNMKDLDDVESYWDLFFLIEKSRYVLYREILCGYSNLHSYGKELRFEFVVTGYYGHYPEPSDFNPPSQ